MILKYHNNIRNKIFKKNINFYNRKIKIKILIIKKSHHNKEATQIQNKFVLMLILIQEKLIIFKFKSNNNKKGSRHK